jgi:dsDNA-binding SOS-regulon protein
MIFASKQDADAYDTTLEIADSIQEYIDREDFGLSEGQLESLSLFIAENRKEIIKILRVVKKFASP